MREHSLKVLVCLGFLALLVTGCSEEDDCTTPDPQPTTAQFVGSQTCNNASCHNGTHAANYAEWITSGHPYKLTKIQGVEPSGLFPDFSAYPNDAVDPPGTFTWADISYTIGGYFWKMRWIDDEGWIVTGIHENQRNFENQTWSDYHFDDASQTKPYDCGACHTTGWVADDDAATDGDLTDNQDGLPGMYGTFFAGGIHCEECHGKGSLHVNSPTEFGMVVDDSSDLCGRCHTRDPLGILAKNGFIRHHEQYDEWRRSPHAILSGGPGCNDCHDPHASTVYDDDPDALGSGVTAACTDCHAANQYTPDPPHPVTPACTLCHMPAAGKSAINSNKFDGDVATHIWAINTDAVNMEEGMGILASGQTFVKTDPQTGMAKLTLDFTCYTCHTDPISGEGGGMAGPKDLATLSGLADGMHPNSTKAQQQVAVK